MEKERIRNRVKAQKSLLTRNEKLQAAAAVFSQLEKEAAFLLSDKILMYHSLADELSTVEFIGRWHEKKNFFLPRVNGVNLEILPYEESRLELGAFHIEEPTGNDTVPVEEIEMIVVPGIAFDGTGNRVGRGKGYYDRLLAHTKAYKVGVGYDFQYVEEGIEAEVHDIKVDMVITQSHRVVIKNKSRNKHGNN